MDIKKAAEPFRYTLKVARINLTPEEESIVREESEAGGFGAFKRAIDTMTGKHASPDEYAEFHRRKEKDLR